MPRARGSEQPPSNRKAWHAVAAGAAIVTLAWASYEVHDYMESWRATDAKSNIEPGVIGRVIGHRTVEYCELESPTGCVIQAKEYQVLVEQCPPGAQLPSVEDCTIDRVRVTRGFYDETAFGDMIQLGTSGGGPLLKIDHPQSFEQ